MKDKIPIGCVVRVRELPADIESFPDGTQAAFRAALDKTFTVAK